MWIPHLVIASIVLGLAAAQDTLTVFEALITDSATNVIIKINQTVDGCKASQLYYYTATNSTRFYFDSNDTTCASTLESASPGVLVSCSITSLAHHEGQYNGSPQWEYAITGEDIGVLLVRPSSVSPWGTVCDDYFTNREAMVACTALGFGSINKAKVMTYTAGNTYLDTPIYMDDVQCANSSATSLGNCSYIYSTEFVNRGNCQHYEDVAIDCRGAPETDPGQWQLRIAEEEPGRGRLEMRPDNESAWGTVCDDSFDNYAALAACRSLGYTNITYAYSIWYYGGGTGTIYLDDVICNASTYYLQECQYLYSTADNRWENCNHYEDVGIDCRGIEPVNSAPIVGYTATMNSTLQEPQEAMQRIADRFYVPVSRIWLYSTSEVADGIVTLQFRFLDPDYSTWNTARTRDSLDFSLLNVDRQGVGSLFGFNTLTSNSTRDQRPDSWQFTITGSSPYAGLLTVRPDAATRWGTVCDDYFDTTAALAACLSIGLNSTRATYYPASSPLHNTGTGPIYMDNVVCPANSSNLMNCSYIYSTENETNHDCSHSEDVTINCYPDGNQPFYLPPASQWQYRIDGGGNSGMLLARPSSVSPWGTVCDDYFTNREALVACRQLGYNVTKAKPIIYGANTAYSQAPIYMDNVQCTNSSATSLGDCSYIYSTEFVRRNDCLHYEDVGIDCNGPPATDPAQWQLRLAETELGRGRLEMRPDNESAWGTVCDDGFDSDAALATCHSLGFNVTFAFFFSAGGGTGTIYLDETNCTGANYLQECSYDFSTASETWNDCYHWEDVGVDCRGIVPVNNAPIVGYTATINSGEQTVEETATRVADYMYVPSTRVWVFATEGPDDKNTTVIHFRFTDPDQASWYSVRSRDNLDYFFLSVNRQYIGTLFGMLTLTSNSTRDQRPDTWQFTITGSSPYAGLLTVRPNTTTSWGTVCDDYFDTTAALAACLSIGFNSTRATLIGTSSPLHNTGTGPIYMDNVVCPANSSNLMNCSYIYSTESEINHDCTHLEDVTINCYPDGNQPLYVPPSSQWQYKISSGDTTGLLLVRPSSVSPWGTVCDDYFTDKEALVACLTMGFNVTKAKANFYSGMVIYNNAPIYLDDVRCPAGATNLIDSCTFVYSTEFVRRDNCQHTEDVAVDCRGAPYTDPNQWQLRLAESEPGLGRLEMRPDNVSDWGTVCDDGFDNNAAMAACRSLGYTDLTHAYFLRIGGGTGTIYLDETNCTGANYLQQCSYDFSTATQRWNDCSHYEDVGVDCRGIVPANNAPIIGYTATINVTQQSAEVTLQRIATVLGVNMSRLWLFDAATPSPGNEIETIQFRFVDPSVQNWNLELGRQELDTRLIGFDRSGVTTYFGIILLLNNKTNYQTQFDVRLSQTAFTNIGRVEVKPVGTNDSYWGTVCQDAYFNPITALSVCHSAGYDVSKASLVVLPSASRAGSGPIYLSSVSCDQYSTYLSNCTYTVSNNVCVHLIDAWIQCGPTAQPRALNFSLAPVESNSTNVGILRVQLEQGGPWDYVCSYSLLRLRWFNNADAKLACNALGMPSTAAATYQSQLSVSDATYGMANLDCPTGATSLAQCGILYDSRNMQGGFCVGGWTVAVDCTPDNASTWEYRVIPEHETKPKRGRFEVRPSANDQWGTVCSDYFNDYAAQYACAALGYPTDKAYMIKWYGMGNNSSPIYLDDVNCQADSNTLFNCSYLYSPPGKNYGNCAHWEDVGIDCTGDGKPPLYPIEFTALVSDNGDSMIDGMAWWFYTTEDRFAVTNNVSNGTEPFRLISFVITPGDRPTQSVIENGLLNLDGGARYDYMDMLRLTNNASDYIRSTMEFRLVDGPSPLIGRLEIRPDMYSAWGTVCDDGFDANAANSMCHSIGYPYGGMVVSNNYNLDTLHIYLDNSDCQQGEFYYQNCTFSYSTFDNRVDNCLAHENIALQCFDSTTTAPTTTTNIPTTSGSATPVTRITFQTVTSSTSQSVTSPTSTTSTWSPITTSGIPPTSTSVPGTITTGSPTGTTNLLTTSPSSSATNAPGTITTGSPATTTQATPSSSGTTTAHPTNTATPVTGVPVSSSTSANSVTTATTGTSTTTSTTTTTTTSTTTPAPTHPPSGTFTVTLNQQTTPSVFAYRLADLLNISSVCYEQQSYTANTLTFRFVDNRNGCAEPPKTISTRLENLWSTQQSTVSQQTGIDSLSAPSDDSPPSAGGSGLGTPAIVGIVVGVLILVAVGVAAALFYRSRPSANEELDEDFISMNEYQEGGAI